MGVCVLICIFLCCMQSKKRGISYAKLEKFPTKVETIINGSVLFDCPLEAFDGFRWDYNGELLFVEIHPVNTKFKGSQNLLRNYSLYFTGTSLLHEGIYECKNDTLKVASYLLEVLVPADLSLQINGRNVTSNVTVPVDKPFAAICYAFGGKPKVNLSWVIEGVEVLPIRSTSTQTDVKSEVRHIPLYKNGNITCITDTQSLIDGRYISAYYTTYVLPKVSISADELNVHNRTLYVAMGDVLTLHCQIHGPSYFMQTYWAKDGVPVGVSDEITGTQRDGAYILGSENLLALRHTVQRTYQNVSCVAVSKDPMFEVHANITLVTYIVPNLVILVNNKDVSGSSISLENNEELFVSCTAYGSLPPVDLSYQTNDGVLSNTTKVIQRNKKNSMTYDTHAYVVYRQTKKHGKIKCITKGIIQQQQQYGIVFSYIKSNNQPENSSEIRNTPVVAVLVVLIFLLMVGLTIASFYKRLGGVSVCTIPGQDVPTYEHSFQEGVFTKKDNFGYKDRFLVIDKISAMPQLSSTKQRETDSGEYQAVAEYVEDYYSEMRGLSGDRTRMILHKDICFITCLKLGKTYIRWMGTMATHHTARKNAFITTIPETPSSKYLVNWDSYVKRILELPEAPNITRLLGICTDKDSLFLLHEHLDGEPLANCINLSITSYDSERIKRKAATFLKDILSGMEFIHSFGFLHPGFSLKKVLLTNDGICKLYDFRLPDDSSRKVICMKETMACTLNEFPPESLMRNEYDQDSDKWSVGVVIWQILTTGCQPFIDRCSDENSKPSLPDNWPYQNGNGIAWTNLLLTFWSFTPFDRPSVRNVRLAFDEMLAANETNSETYGYTRMEDLQQQ